jgi:hypothetical protein
VKKIIRIGLLLFLVLVFACGLGFWTEYSPVGYDYKLIYRRNTNESSLLFAFATALRINHRAAYDMIDPSLKPRLDEWMNKHQSKKCKEIPHYFTIEPGTRRGSKVVSNCLGNNEWIDFSS